MRLVDLHEGKLELRWTWLPYWLVAGPRLQAEVEAIIRDIVVLNGMPPTEDSLDRIERFLLDVLDRRFKIKGLREYLTALHYVQG